MSKQQISKRDAAEATRSGVDVLQKKKKTGRASKLDDFRVLNIPDKDGTIMITIVNMNGRPSSSYWYSSASGKLEKGDNLPVEWVGTITVSPNYQHRLWATAKNIFKSFGIPVEAKELEQFITARGDRLWYRVKFKDGKVGSVYLPRLLAFAKSTQKYSEKEEAIVSSVVVAPHRRRHGFGSILHKLMALHLKGLGYTRMVSDIVGMNTDAEIAIWRALQTEASVTPFKEKFSLMGTLHKLNIVNDVMVKAVHKHTGTHVNGVLMTQGKISKKKFRQFELDLTDKRIFMLEKAA
jgi:GNAT superfamily N-acetyltransferase